MYLGPAHPPASGAHALIPARFDAPGGTIGRVAGNHLVLPDPSGAIGRLQAVVRLRGAECRLVNLGGPAPVTVNGRSLAQGEEAAIAAGDRVGVGGYVLAVDAGAGSLAEGRMQEADGVVPLQAAAPAVAAAAALAAPLATQADGPVQAAASVADLPPVVDAPAGLPAFEPAPAVRQGQAPLASSPPPAQPEPEPVDIFADLMGPGTLPVGSAPDISCHPFDMASAAPRNTPDPLSLLPGEPVRHVPGKDPLSFFDQVDAAHAPSIFSDRTPTSMTSGVPATVRGDQPIADMLSGDRERNARSTADHVTQMSGYMRPTNVRRDDSGG
ncbi:Uncharacterized protein ImpI/VasC [plant metagenome]|uniref:Uncharacterized protein ImpI/VasC n=2 Tax=plant metagenome TaxID=1297885 RepID=A0A484UFR9_9ZZZZ